LAACHFPLQTPVGEPVKEEKVDVPAEQPS
jgi:hypothetical protein